MWKLARNVANVSVLNYRINLSGYISNSLSPVSVRSVYANCFLRTSNISSVITVRAFVSDTRLLAYYNNYMLYRSRSSKNQLSSNIIGRNVQMT